MFYNFHIKNFNGNTLVGISWRECPTTRYVLLPGEPFYVRRHHLRVLARRFRFRFLISAANWSNRVRLWDVSNTRQVWTARGRPRKELQLNRKDKAY